MKISGATQHEGNQRSQMASAALNQSAVANNLALLDYEDYELCQVHPGEVMIAVDGEDNTRYGCNKCVFEGRLADP